MYHIHICILTNKYKLRLHEEAGFTLLLSFYSESTSSNHTRKVGRRQENKAKVVNRMQEDKTSPLK
jgi:hypothetical protein